MRIIRCDRCKADITEPYGGYISSMLRDLKTDELTGDNPFEDWDLCPRCLEQIDNFIRYPDYTPGGCKPEFFKEEPEPDPEPKKLIFEEIEVEVNDPYADLAEVLHDAVDPDALYTEAPEDPAPAAKKKTGGKMVPVDHGKIVALARAGWSVAKIADEMRCSDQTVRNHLAKEMKTNE